MIYFVVALALIAAAALAVAGWVVVNAMRVYAPMVKTNADIAERSARYSEAVDFAVEKRLVIVNQRVKKAQDFLAQPSAGPDTAEAPTEDEIAEARIQEERQRREEAADALSSAMNLEQ